jgi:UPF0716 protein FxsA
MPFPFPLLFIALPIIELTGLILAGEEFGALNVVLWVILSFLIGIQVIRMAGWVTARNLQDSMRRGDMPLGAMFQAAGMVFAGIFLIIPGFLTDFIGLLLLIAPVRDAIGRSVATKSTFHTHSSMHGTGFTQNPTRQDDSVIDGEFTVVDDAQDDQTTRKPSDPTEHIPHHKNSDDDNKSP